MQKQIKAIVFVSAGAGFTFSGLNIKNGNEQFYRDYVMPLTHLLDPETSHRLAIFAMKYCLIRKDPNPDSETLVNILKILFIHAFFVVNNHTY